MKSNGALITYLLINFPRLSSAACFATAAMICVLLVSLLIRRFWSDLHLSAIQIIILYGFIPVVLTGLFGYLIGSSILIQSKTTTDKRPEKLGAVLKGIAVGFLAFFSFIFILCLVIAQSFGSNPNVIGDFIVMLIFYTFYCFLFFGWLIAIGSAVTGWMLWKLRDKYLNKNSAEIVLQHS